MEHLDKMPRLVLTLHAACIGFEDMVWRDLQVCNDISMHELAQSILNSFNVEDLSNYTIVSAGEKFTVCERNGIRTSDSKKFTMADLYMDKGESFLIDAACHEFDVKIIVATDAQTMDATDYPKVLAKSNGSLVDAQRLIDLEFPD